MERKIEELKYQKKVKELNMNKMNLCQIWKEKDKEELKNLKI